MMEYSEDHIALAAEYALGTLDADERAQVETMMAVDSGVHRDRAGLGIPARRAEPDGRLGRAAARTVGPDQDGDRLRQPRVPLVLPEPPPPAAAKPA